ncbi:hypothetical protein [Rhodococcoides kyotonense]|uniref:Mce-associated membrane protein n=1 Tax=Rhodococcoides kyotonense TaxID=398843 RepID=A0A177YK03_9NOCA|nr:hypothetical protein [Rhodococcus kyotonensis]OAK55559.1 hypothetical protein A3K89_19600 [Rhodococcus kyotonensis]
MTLRRIVAAMIATTLVAAVAVLGYLVVQNRTMDELRSTAVASATQYTEQLATYDYTDPTANLDAVTSSSTADFASSYRNVSDKLTGLLSQGQGQATGHVTSAGVVELSSEHAVVALFLDQSVRNLTAPDGRTDSSRMLVRLERDGDRWLLASAEPR